MPDVLPRYNATLPVPPPITPTNVTLPPNPGSREGSFSWYVHNNGRDILWLFGGLTRDEFCHSDVWTYDLTSDTWTWVAGSNTTAGGGNQYNSSAPGGAAPSPRAYGASWVGEDGGLYLFGGFRILFFFFLDKH